MAERLILFCFIGPKTVFAAFFYGKRLKIRLLQRDPPVLEHLQPVCAVPGADAPQLLVRADRQEQMQVI